MVVDLEAAYHITSVRIWNRVDCCGDRLTPLQVELLTWVTPAQQWIICNYLNITPAVAGAVHNVSCGGVVASEVKLTLLHADYLTLCEVEVWGIAVSIKSAAYCRLK